MSRIKGLGKWGSISPHHFFLIIAIFFGGIFIFLVPPFQAPDEVGHFYKAYHITEGQLLGTKIKANRLGGYLPRSLVEFSNPFQYLRHHPERKLSRDSMNKASQLTLKPEEYKFIDFPNIAFHAPTAYLGQNLAIGIGRLLGCSPICLFYLARIGAFFVWLAFVYFAIKIIPFHKWTFTLLALLPSSLFINSSLNSDPITNGLCFFFIAYCLYLAFEYRGQILKKEYFLLLLFSVVISLNKLFYTPLILLVLLIPSNQFKSRLHKFLSIGILLLINAGVVLFWYFKTKENFIPYDLYDPFYRELLSFAGNVNPDQQLQYILHHPFLFLKKTCMSLWESKGSITAHFFGKFGWGKNYLPSISIAILALITMVLSCCEQTKKQAINKRQRSLFFFIVGCSILLICTILYLVWSPYQGQKIMDIQGRYFIAVAPLLFIGFRNQLFTIKQSFLIRLVQIIIIASLLLSVYAVVLRYYW